MNNDLKNKGKSGIYIIKNNINGKIYVGKTKCFYNRYFRYRYSFFNKNTDSLNSYFLKSMLKHGWDNFSYSVLEYCTTDMLTERECYWILKLKSTDRNIGYNLQIEFEHKTFKTPELCKIQSKNMKNLWSIESFRKKRIQSLKKSWTLSRKTRQSSTNSNAQTKYIYRFYKDGTFKDYRYKDLVKMKMDKSIHSKFSVKKTDMILYKLFTVERIRL